jgi:hypothetical protein
MRLPVTQHQMPRVCYSIQLIIFGLMSSVKAIIKFTVAYSITPNVISHNRVYVICINFTMHSRDRGNTIRLRNTLNLST